MIYLDGFSGYGGFHLGLERAGFKFSKCYFSEMDKHAIANYSYNYPNSIYAGLIQHINRTTAPHIDLFTFGWPCQDNSTAGKRRGQSEGTRSGLLNEAARILNEYKPRHFIAENVTGLFSVNKGVDYIEAIKVLSDLGESLPQYDIEMQLCNTLWLLPQNRERLLFVGHLRGTGCRQVLPIAAVSKPKVLKIENRQIQSRKIGREGYWSRPYAPTLLSGSVSRNVFVDWERKVTPTECERFQGLPDDWTRYGNYSGVINEISDTQRYKLCGNGVSVPIVEMIAKKLYELNYKQNENH